MKWYLEALRKYAVFTGRSRRRAFWLFVTFSLGITVLLGMIDGGLRNAPDSDLQQAITQLTAHCCRAIGGMQGDVAIG
ncbi:MAG: hypothetical protein IT332_02670 [Ardenticatenales bacterium]|nr:hypothetical protein [Ardenticatenales bacterium]